MLCKHDHLNANICRFNNNIYKVIDYCLAEGPVGIQREIMKNGPVVAQMSVTSDFLIYKEGVYHETSN